MSDSGPDLPSDAAISNTLRDVVLAIHKSGKHEDLTVKRVRTRAEQELGLADGFFKTHETWKQKSNDVIVEAVSTHAYNGPCPLTCCIGRPLPGGVSTKASPKESYREAEAEAEAL